MRALRPFIQKNPAYVFTRMTTTHLLCYNHDVHHARARKGGQWYASNMHLFFQGDGMKNIMRLLACITLAGALAFLACDSEKGNSNALLLLLLGGGGGATGDTVVSIAALSGVTPPVYGETPVSTITETDQYTGTVSWSPDDDPFDESTVYSATITLTPKTGYTLTGVATDFFTVAGADSVSNPEHSGVITAVFPETGIEPDIEIEFESAEQTGGASGTADSTALTLTFDADPAALTADNITVTGAAKGALSGSGTTRSIAISDITVANGATISVTITSPAGYSITGSPKTAVVYRSFYAGYKETCAGDGVSFGMVYVPGGLTFPVGVDDNGDIDNDGDQDVPPAATVADACWIGETEVTYELWSAVYAWATGGTGGAAGEGEYTFANAGGRGGYSDIVHGWMTYSSGHETHPVTMANWRDSMVWCNALTEWHNARNGTSYACVYTYSSAILRDSTNATACDGAAAGSTADGFRLLTVNEYELAARYRDGTLWTYGDHASGDDSGACYNDGSFLGGLDMSSVYGEYSVHMGNSGDTTAEVASKTDNALGLYDMSGNVWEWCYDQDSFSSRMVRGGSFANGSMYMQVGFSSTAWNPGDEYVLLGFRIARSAD